MSIAHIFIGTFLTLGLFTQPSEPPVTFRDYAPTFSLPAEAKPLQKIATAPTSLGAVSGGGCSLEYIKQREAGGNYSTNTGNGYYGAYQYSASTWNNYGGYSTADQAPPSVQDERAAADLAAGKQSQWSVC